MPEPSLSEILSVPADPERASGTPAVVIDNRDMVRNLNEAARFNAELKQRRYAESLNGLKDLYQDIGRIQGVETMEEDKPLLAQKMGEVFQEIGDHPQELFSPRGSARFADIQKKLGELKTLATESKQNNVLDTFHNQYVQSDADLDTPENRKVMEAYKKTPLGQRKGYLLEMPPVFDAQKASENIMKSKNVGVPYAETEFSADNKFITKKTGTEYKREPYLKDWNSGYDANPTIQKWSEKTFEKAKKTPSELDAYSDPDTGEVPKNAKELYSNLGKIKWGHEGDFKAEKTSIPTANPYELLNKRQLNALALEGYREGNREKLAAVKAKLSLEGLEGNSDFLLRQYAGIVGNTTGQKITSGIGGNKVEEDQVTLPANVLKQYAQTEKETLHEGSSLDPVSETIVSGTLPDVTTRTKDGDIRVIFYQHYKKGDKIPADKKIGDVIQHPNGYQEIETTGIIPKRNLLAVLGKGVMQQKMLAPAIDNADQKLRGKGNKYIDDINAGKEEQPKKEEKTYRVGKITITETQIEKGAKKYKMTPEQYKASIGAQ